MREFSNEYLKPGMFVELKNGHTGVLIPCYNSSTNKEQLTVVGGDKLYSRECVAQIYNKYEGSNYGIVKVYDLNKGNGASLFSSTQRDLLWEYEEPKKEMTIAEIEAKLGYKIKIVDTKEEK